MVAGLLGAGLSLFGGLLGNVGTTAGLLAMQKSAQDLQNTTLSTSTETLAHQAKLHGITMAVTNKASALIAGAYNYQTILSTGAKQLIAHKEVAKAFTGIVDSIS